MRLQSDARRGRDRNQTAEDHADAGFCVEGAEAVPGGIEDTANATKGKQERMSHLYSGVKASVCNGFE